MCNVRIQITALHRQFVEVRRINSNEVYCIPRINFDLSFIRHTMQIRPYFADNSCCAKLMQQRSMDVKDHTIYSLNECLSERVSNCIVPEIRPTFGFCEGVT